MLFGTDDCRLYRTDRRRCGRFDARFVRRTGCGGGLCLIADRTRRRAGPVVLRVMMAIPGSPEHVRWLFFAIAHCLVARFQVGHGTDQTADLHVAYVRIVTDDFVQFFVLLFEQNVERRHVLKDDCDGLGAEAWETIQIGLDALSILYNRRI